MKKKFLTLLLLLFLSRAFDFFTTIAYIPDPRLESNPVVRLFDLNYGMAGIIQLVVLGFVSYCLYVYCFKKVEMPPVPAGTPLLSFVNGFHFCRFKKSFQIFYRLPTNKNSYLYMLGFVVTYTLIAVGFLVGTSTTLLLISTQYKSLYKMGIPFVLYGSCFVIAALTARRFYMLERARRMVPA